MSEEHEHGLRNEWLRQIAAGPPLDPEHYDMIRKGDARLLYLIACCYAQGAAVTGCPAAVAVKREAYKAVRLGTEPLRGFLLVNLGAPEYDQEREAALRWVEGRDP